MYNERLNINTSITQTSVNVSPTITQTSLSLSPAIGSSLTTWGSITGVLSNQTDLYNVLSGKISLTDLSSTATGLTYNNTTGIFSLTSGYTIPLSATLSTFITKDVDNLTYYTKTSDLPAVNNGLLTIKKNNTSIGTFSANQSTNESINIEVPTKTSDLTNDSGFIDTTYHDATKQNVLTAGENINILNNVISATDTKYTAGTGISIENNVISNTQISAEWGNITGTLSNQTDLSNALNNKQNVINDLSTIRTNATHGESAYGTISGYGDIVTRNAYEFATSAQGLKADTAIQPNDNITELTNNAGYITKSVNNLDNYTTTADMNALLDDKVTKNNAITGGTKTKITYDAKGLVTEGTDLIESDIPNLHLSKVIDVTASAQEVNYLTGTTNNVQSQINEKLNITDVINNITTTTINQALSANMGKELQDQINNLKQRGRYLSIWNCTTGLAETTPTVNPYTYKAGDYFLVGTVGATNYRPNGTTYDKDVPSTTVETGAVVVNDAYYYDGTSWSLLHTEQPTVAFSTLAGSPYDNANMTTALNAKVSGNNAITGATKTKITYDSKGLVTGGTDLVASDIPNFTLSKITDVTATATELNYVDGVTSNIQTQLDGKQDILTAGTGINFTGANNNVVDIMQSDINGEAVIVHGTPTYRSSDNSYTGFSTTSDYLSTPNQIVVEDGQGFEIVMKLTLPSYLPNKWSLKVLTPPGSQALSGYFFTLTGDGHRAHFGDLGCSGFVQSNFYLMETGSTHWFRLKRVYNSSGNNYTYTISACADGQSWSTIGTSILSGWGFTLSSLEFLQNNYPNYWSYWGNGRIYLNECYFKVDDTVVWSGQGSLSKSVAKATNSLYGLVKPDNSTISVNNGVITANYTSYHDSTKQDTLTAGTNITIVDNVISATGGGSTYTAGENITITSGSTINALAGLTSTVAELNYVDGVTSNIQTQIDGKVATSLLTQVYPIISTYVSGASGYRIWSDGYCEQWGTCNINASGSSFSRTISYVKTFSSDSDYNIFFTADATAGALVSMGDKVANSILVRLVFSGSQYVACVYWKACGYLAEGEY